MSTFSFQGKQIFYRAAGEGKPLLLLNGIMMSTLSWQPFETCFTRENRLILLDLLDQGQSDKYECEYDQSVQVEVVRALLDHLGVEKVSIMGTSYGGEVALQFAVKYLDRVEKLVLANTVARTNAWLREIGEAWNLAVGDPVAYYSTTIPVIYSPHFYDRRAEWMQARKELLTRTAFASKPFLDSMIRLTNSANSHDVTAHLADISVPALIIACEMDHITPIEEQRALARTMPNAQLVILPDTGHAAFYERPELFSSILLGFVNLQPPVIEL